MTVWEIALPMKRFFTWVLLFFIPLFTLAASVDTLAVASLSMHKTYKIAVVTPDGYAKSKSSYPVLYLLHGAWGHFSDWLKNTPDKMLVKNLADQYNLIIVLPEGETFGWYLNSPVNPASQFETFVAGEVIPKVDAAYRTVANRQGRVITGLSMGGHGALYLSARHPDLFCAAGSMSGALDVELKNWRLDANGYNTFKKLFEGILGTDSTLYPQYSVINLADKMKSNGLKLMIDCGTEDFLIEPNRELHRRLLYNHTPHDYIERPGGHTWDYWQNALPFHLLFLTNVLRSNGVMVPKTASNPS
jgi:S-formylglutathione hydrolase FrmB